MAAVEQLGEAEKLKAEGNRQHQEGNYKKALGAYHKVFCFINGLVPPPANQDLVSLSSNQIPPEKVNEVRRLKETTRLNMAACYLKLGEHQKCVDACNQALELGQNPKAYFRRAQAYLELRNFSAASSDLDRADALGDAASATSATAPLRKALRQAQRGGDGAEKKRCAKMLEVDKVDKAAPSEATDPQAAEATAETPVTAAVTVAETPTPTRAEVKEVDLSVPDEAQKLQTTVRELTYAWQQTDAEVKVYIPFDQSEELANVQPSQVEVDFGEWSASVLLRVGDTAPFGLRLTDFQRRLAPEKCSWALRSSRITLKLVKREAEHWWSLLQKSSA